MSELRLVLVIGKGRSGSTLLDDLLGTMPSVTSIGELSLLWQRGSRPDYVCSCGRTIPECAVWSVALTAAIGGTDAERIAGVRRLQAETFRWLRLPTLTLGSISAADRRLGGILGRLYRAIAETTGSRVIVDSSKWPAHPALFRLVPGVTPFVLHLIRDPRAVAHSYERLKARSREPDAARYGLVASALSWDARNVAAELFARKVAPAQRRRIRYEDLVAEPRATIGELGAWLGIGEPVRAFVDTRRVHLGTGHLIGGNRRRFLRGELTITADDEWKTRMTTRAHRIVSALTGPLRRRYGYPAVHR
jgi:hypothetical protein